LSNIIFNNLLFYHQSTILWAPNTTKN